MREREEEDGVRGTQMAEAQERDSSVTPASQQARFPPYCATGVRGLLYSHEKDRETGVTEEL